MKTYQDLMEHQNKDIKTLTDFIISVIAEHKASDLYRTAVDAKRYTKQQNTTIMEYVKLLYTISGKAVPDNYSANHKMCSNFFYRFVVQESQYLLGNGVTFNNEDTKGRIGGDDLDSVLQTLAMSALIGAVSFGFFNMDHIEPFEITEFAPLWDEEDGSLKAGVRYWQIDDTKPLRVTLYELDGYTEFIKRKMQDLEVLHEKRQYIQIVKSSVADGEQIVDGENYRTFPIVPMWGNMMHQSELCGIKTQIDAYDLIKSGFCNDLDDCTQIYWLIKNAGGMDDIDYAEFLQRVKRTRVASTDDDRDIKAESIEIPYQSRSAYLDRLERDLYNDAMALNVSQITSGNVTATAIRASYEPLNNKTDMFEYCVRKFIKSILELAGIEDSPTFKRSTITNQAEETTMILQASQYLDYETILKHLPFISPDEISNILDNLTVEEAERFDDDLGESEEDEIDL